MWFGVTVSLHHVKSQTLLAHELFRTNGALKRKEVSEDIWFCVLVEEQRTHLVGHVSSVRDHVQPQLLFPLKRCRAGSAGELLA